jgi:mRNA interferase MazF
MVEYQWGIFWANLNPVKGSEQAGKRPVLIISAEEVNQVLPVVTVIALTSVKEDRKIYPTEVFLSASDTGLPKDSIAMAHQIRSVAKERLQQKSGHITSIEVREKIKIIIRLYLDI